MNKAVVYTRVSTDGQDTQRQSDDIKLYCAYKKLSIEKEFSEKITGASKIKKRPEFGKMLQYIIDNNIKNLVVSEISRLGRIHLDTAKAIEELTNNKVCIHSLKESLVTLNEYGEKNPGSSLLLALFFGIAEMELDTLTYRVTSGLNKSRRNGGGQSGIGAYGFMNFDKKLVLNPDEVPTVKKIFDMYLLGMGSTLIAKFLNEHKVPTKGRAAFWSETVIHNILRNPIYKGQRIHKDNLIQLSNELIIIPPTTFDKVQLILTNKFNKKDVNRIYLNILSGKIHCSCGKGMYLHRRPIINGYRKDNTYKCLSTRYKYKGEPKTCTNLGINIDLINSVVAFHVDQAISGDNVRLRSKELETELNRKYKELKKNESKHDRLAGLYVEGNIDRTRYDVMNDSIQKHISKNWKDINVVKQKYDEAIAFEVQIRYFSPEGKLRDKPISTQSALIADQLLMKVSSHISKIVVQTVTDQYMELKKATSDIIHKVVITNLDNSFSVYFTANISKLVYLNDEIILEKPDSIFI